MLHPAPSAQGHPTTLPPWPQPAAACFSVRPSGPERERESPESKIPRINQPLSAGRVLLLLLLLHLLRLWDLCLHFWNSGLGPIPDQIKSDRLTDASRN